MTPLLWTLVAIQIAMGAFDTFYHHEFTERLAWRPSQRHELQLHSVRNMLYALLFLVLGWLEVHGILAIAILAVLAVEVPQVAPRHERPLPAARARRDPGEHGGRLAPRCCAGLAAAAAAAEAPRPKLVDGRAVQARDRAGRVDERH